MPFQKNGELGKRTPFNDNKTRLYRPSIYELLSEDGIVDSNLNFWYSPNPDDEKTDKEINSNWTRNKNK